ncbi:craniofacial development protein 1 [Tribolium madens]|uniref:craniofacial development protein 1 n=1 Tax=Tribolium madens TaxID=41895 RepID=UPI001CF747C7|nr:craniofacial development protein 1 [Tribolium madens]XP_044270891.1 craniofacial development protein 1 [Tribolium madens]XP_044270892.1 craniofacial development protein 1 [Tribolium madens]XP_044270893.1 craniofacial development protein 1 [Tribolium madens]
MDPEELPENSDSSDEDYVPDKKEENVSEVESDGDPESDLSDSENVSAKAKKRTKHSSKARKKQKPIEEEVVTTKSESKQVTEEEKKKLADDIWADFMKDTGFQSKKDIAKNLPTNSSKSTTVDSVKKTHIEEKKPETVKITQVFKFAGEEVKVEKEVVKDSIDARLSNKSTSEPGKAFKSKGGLSGILSQLGKKPKISTLEKSKLDWDQFKKEENLQEELLNHNKGKDGYLERQDFLQRADLRRFEIEKEIRSKERSKRLNNA